MHTHLSYTLTWHSQTVSDHHRPTISYKQKKVFIIEIKTTINRQTIKYKNHIFVQYVKL